MRRIAIAAVVSMIAPAAHAADWPDLPALRGSFSEAPVARNWEGTYVGGQYGFSSADINFTNAASSLTNSMLKNDVLQSSVGSFDLLQNNHKSATGFGGFVGRNWQWEDAVLGFEVNYNRFVGASSSSANTMSLTITNPPGLVKPDSDTYYYYTRLDGQAAWQIQDAMTFRMRAGWDAGNFMPYMFAGGAVGRIDVSRAATLNVTRQIDRTTTTTDPLSGTSVTSTQTISVTPRPEQTLTEERSSSFVAGYTAGLGTEIALTRNLFARAEWEYIKFLKVKDISASVNTVRAGVGYRF